MIGNRRLSTVFRAVGCPSEARDLSVAGEGIVVCSDLKRVGLMEMS